MVIYKCRSKEIFSKSTVPVAIQYKSELFYYAYGGLTMHRNLKFAYNRLGSMIISKNK